MTHHQSGSESQFGQQQGSQMQGGQQQGTRMQGGQQQGTQMQGGQQGGHQQSPTMSNTLPDHQWTALTNVAQAIAVCEYCKSQCVMEADPMMIECIRLCEDVAELGKTTLSLTPQESRYQDQIVAAFERAVQACAQECGQHEHAHCQQCAQVLTQTLDGISQLKQGGMGSQQFEQGQQTGQFGGQRNQGQQFGQY